MEQPLNNISFVQGRNGEIIELHKGCYIPWQVYLQRMCNSAEYADEVAVIATAYYLKCRINVITSPPNLNNIDDALKIYMPSGHLNCAELWLGHRHENHYVSLVSC